MASSTSRRTFLASGLAAAGTLAVAGMTDLAAAAPVGSSPVSPDAALKALQDGNRRFVSGKTKGQSKVSARRAELVEGQSPFAVILGCSDSRLPAELVFDQGLGQLFGVRVAGNTAADPLVVGSAEYSVSQLKSPLIVVLGHDDCGAVKAAIDVVTKGTSLPGQLPAVIQPIIPAVQAVASTPPDQMLAAAVTENIRRAVTSISAEALIAPMVANGSVKVVGAEYRLATGKVDFLT